MYAVINSQGRYLTGKFRGDSNLTYSWTDNVNLAYVLTEDQAQYMAGTHGGTVIKLEGR